MVDYLQKLGKLTENINLEKYNTYKIKKKAKYLFLPNSVNDLIKALKYMNENKIKYLLIGNGSNIILSDKYFDGIVIKLSLLEEITITEKSVKCGAGVMLPKLVIATINNNLRGLEWAFGIPGNIGGSVAGNAGAYNSCIFDFINEVTFIDENLELKTLKKDELEYDYRTSSFKNNKNWIIVSTVLDLNEGPKEEAKLLIEDRLKRRKDSQPLEYPSAGSVFRNPENNFAGKLIEDFGFKNKNIGGAYVSDKHANFIINKNKATGKEIKELIELIKEKIFNEYNIELIVEQEFIDW